MKSAIFSTLIMGLIAVAASVGAATFYPWPEVSTVDEMVGTNLFEAYENTKVRGMEIIEFNRDRDQLERVKLRRSGDKWLAPNKENFVATEGARIGAVVNSLADLKIVESMSDKQEDHLKYGVVDPIQYQNVSNTGALGTKLILTDRKGDEIGNLIIGFPVKNNDASHIEQRFARVAGQPHVYVLKYDSTILTTDFAGWMSTNPLQLKSSAAGPGQSVTNIFIDNYRLARAAEFSKTTLYHAELMTSAEGISASKVEFANKPNSPELVPVATPGVYNQVLGPAAVKLGNILFRDVKRKETKVANAIKKKPDTVENGLFGTMKNFGFVNGRYENDFFTCDSTFGQISVFTPQGVRMDVMFGDPVSSAQDGSGQLVHYVTISASVDFDRLPKVLKPTSLDPDPNSEEHKNYLRMKKEADDAANTARQMASEINKLHADWYYFARVDEIEAMRPELPIPAYVAPATPESKPNASEPTGSPSADDSN